MNAMHDPWADAESSQDGINIFGNYTSNEMEVTENILTNFEDDDADFMDITPATQRGREEHNEKQAQEQGTAARHYTSMVFGLPRGFAASSSPFKYHTSFDFAKRRANEFRALTECSRYLYGIYIYSPNLDHAMQKNDEELLLLDREPEFDVAYRMLRDTLLEFFEGTEYPFLMEPLKSQAKWITIFVKRNPVVVFFISFDKVAYLDFEAKASDEENAWPLTFSKEVIGSSVSKVNPTPVNNEEELTLHWLKSTSDTTPDLISRIYFVVKSHLITSRNTIDPDTSFVQNETSTLAREIEDNPRLISTNTSDMSYDASESKLTKVIAMQTDNSSSSSSQSKETKQTNSKKRKERTKLSGIDESMAPMQQDTLDPEASVIARIFGELYIGDVATNITNFNATSQNTNKQNKHTGDPNEKLKSNRKAKLGEEIEPYVLTTTQDSIINNGTQCIVFPSSNTLVNLKSAFLTSLSVQPKFTKKRSRLKTAYPVSWSIFITEYILKSKLPSNLLLSSVSESYNAGNQMYMRFISLVNEIVIKPYQKESRLYAENQGSNSNVLIPTAITMEKKYYKTCGVIIDPKGKDVVKLKWRQVKAQHDANTAEQPCPSSLAVKRCILSKTPLDNVDHYVLDCQQAPIDGEFIWVHTENHTAVIDAIVSAFLLFDVLLPRLTEKTVTTSINHYLVSEGLMKVDDRVKVITELLKKPDASIYKGTNASVPTQTIELLPSNRKYEIAMASFFQKYIAGYPEEVQQSNLMQVEQKSSNNGNSSSSFSTPQPKKGYSIHNMDYLKSVLLEKILVAINMMAAIRARFIQKAKESS